MKESTLTPIGENDVAIVGMALRVPGARTLEQFWANLRGGVESIRRLSEEELIASGESRQRLNHPNYVPIAAELPEMEMFDAEFFGMNPKEAAIMDPQHRQFLECAWEAMEHAARTPESVGGSVGVFAGCGMGSYFYFNVCSHRELVDSVGMFLLRHTGNDKDFLATRASYLFDLRGPSVNIQTACSTSLVAVHAACQSLLSRECDMALAGGVTVEIPHRRGYVFQEGEILSPDGRCHAFDHRAAGTVFGSGVGVVVLRRLSDALADGDPIHAVIKATAVNNDGAHKAGYLAPSVDGQSAAIVEAHGLANIGAESIQYVECHGTGTYLGDPIEVEALTQAFRRSTDQKGFCRIGSVKTNIGHLDTAAGVVSLIKTTLALSHGEIPPSLGFEKPNPAIDFASSPFLVNDRLAPWPATRGPRRAAVNSLGVGGTNAYAVLEEAPARARRAEAARGGAANPQLLILAARHRKALDQCAERLADHLERKPEIRLEDVAVTLFSGRRHFERRRVLVARDREEAIALLRRPDPRRVFTHTPPEGRPSAVFLFPGGGAQYPGMARGLYETDGEFKATVEEGLSCLPEEAGRQIRHLWLAPGGTDAPVAFLRPSFQLPAILIVEVALARSWMRWGVEPAALVGHSMGEYAAACIAGAMSFRDAVRLVHLRGELFDSIKGGGMLSVPLAPAAVRARLPADLDLAVVNAPELCVVSGPRAALDAFHEGLAADGIEAQPVAIDIAAHSRMLEPILGRFEAFLRTVELRAPRIPVVSNRTGTWLTDSEAKDPLYWVRHLRETVQFSAGIATLAADSSRVYLEVGPGKTLGSLLKAQGTVDANQVISSLRHADEAVDDSVFFLTALGRLYATGIGCQIGSLWQDGAHRIELPAYAFQRQRYFLERLAPAAAEQPTGAPLKRADIASWGYRPIWRQAAAPLTEGAERAPGSWLVFLDDAGIGSRLVSRLRAAGHAVKTVGLADSFSKRGEAEYVLSPEHGREGYDALVRDLMAGGGVPQRVVHLWLLTADESFRPGSSFLHRNLERGFYSLLFFSQALGDENAPRPIHITVAANGMQRVGEEQLPYPEKATVLGPARVIPKEMNGVSVRVVDLVLPRPRPRLFGGRVRTALADPFAGRRAVGEALDMVAGRLWEDLLADYGCELVAYRHGRRWVQDYAALALGAPDKGAAVLRDKGVYLITGGFGDLGLVVAEELARRVQARLVLVGRTALPQRLAWDEYLRARGQTDRAGRSIAAIQRLEALGAQVLPVCADVSNLEQMQKGLAEARARFGAIHGVIHAAGQVKDELIQLKSLPDIEDVFTPKVHGTTVLGAQLKEAPLDFTVLFSSTSTDTAPAGQVDYVAANAFLNAYAESCAGRGAHRTLAIHWGVWNQVGLAARAVRGEASGGGPERLRATRQPLFDRWVEDASGKPWLQATWGPATHWLLDEHRTAQGEALWPGTGFLEVIAQALQEYGEQGSFEIEDLLFLRPLHVADRQSRVVHVRLEDAPGGHALVVKSRCELNGRPAFERHAQASVRALGPGRPASLDISGIAGRCSKRRSAPDGASLQPEQAAHLRFGPRWGVLRSIALGQGEALARLELPAAFHHDLELGYLLHPAMLDLATGFAMQLIEGYDASAALWVPVSYKRARVYGPLPAAAWSWVRRVGTSQANAEFAAFDATLTDDAGNVVMEVEQFSIRRLAAGSGLTFRPPARNEVELESLSPPVKSGERSPAQARLAAQIEQGILPGEGAEAFLRVLGMPENAQVIVSSMDLEALRRDSALGVAAASESSRFERPDLDSEYVAPSDEIERTLVGFWEELLGVNKIGVRDSFHDLGGHSLIAVRLFGMIRKAFAVDFPISVLFEAPTIEQCAALIRKTAGAASDQPTGKPVAHQARSLYLVAMHPGEGRRKTPFFLCAGMFGNVLNLRHLAHLIGTDRPFYGLQARGLYGDMKPHETFEEAARDYLLEVRKVQPRGPYLLGGFSGGGISAHAMARQLLAEGESVALLVMLDTPLPTQPRLSLGDRVAMKLWDLRRDGVKYVGTWARRRIEWELGRLRARFEEPLPVSSEHFHNEAIEAAFRAALPRYDVGYYPGRLVLFRPALQVAYRLSGGRLVGNSRQFLYPDNGWTPHVSELSVYEVPGDHDSMVLEPNVRVLAEKLRACIDEAESAAQRMRLDEAAA
jgi:acyl transferase domain-containing protein/thioesterase domain-containing protein/acyl carrier protein